MKRTVLLFALLTFTILGYSQRTSFGLKAGVNIADFNDEVDNASTRTAFHAGGLAHIHLNPNWAIQPELVFSAQGAKVGGDKYELNYLNIPVLVQYMFKSGFRLETGPQLGILIGAEVEESDGDTRDIKSILNDAEVGWAFGLGYLSSSGLGADVRYNLGLTDISDGAGDWENRVWQIGLFYQFRR